MRISHKENVGWPILAFFWRMWGCSDLHPIGRALGVARIPFAIDCHSGNVL